MKNLIKYPEAKYVMPFLFCSDLYIPLLHLLLKDEINPIKYAYGSPICRWQGGRITPLQNINISLIDKHLQRINKLGVTPMFTFSYSYLTQDDLNDEYCNQLLDIAYHTKSMIIISSEELYSHIKSRYPDARLVASVIIPSIKYIKDSLFDETKFYNEMLDKYETVVLRPEYTIDNIEILDKLIRDVSRIEVLINQECKYNCPVCDKHYELQRKLQLNEIDDSVLSNFELYFCPKYNNPLAKSVRMNLDQIDKLLAMGVNHLKIQGRNSDSNVINDILFEYVFNNDVNRPLVEYELNMICAKLIQQNKLFPFQPFLTI